MIGYVTLGTNDLNRAKTFYDTVLAELGGKRGFATDRAQMYAAGAGPMLMVCTPYDKNPATVGNGTMISLAAPSREMVDKVHATALAAGAADEGAPGERMPTFYGAYFRDLDGNKLCVFKMG
ncbi:MAG: VOC family protein [Alphaproteobacteria bacterium]|nr:VOC family protein [Alphaproteobacteria bacterium]MDE2012748.1 VOC family protein [Alphaproteobacteria bacterium]MDE2072581.1 VOC family protein [Alphaproteobacteria bacterium]MDE2351333.1 VOC family protein [Alphaproteobacteria bacterium]